jgi:sugar lactone lactonase YvrE
MRRLLGALSIAALLAGTLVSGPALAARPLPHTIALPGATSAEGIARGAGTTFYAGDLFAGDIFRGNIRTGVVTTFIDAPAGRNALGIRVDLAHGLLFVAGGFTGQGYVYNLRTGADVATFQFGTPPGSIVNDVIVAGGAAWFTDSVQPNLYRVPIHADGTVGSASTLVLSGPAAEVTPGFNLNGIAATPDGSTLIVAHSNNGTIYTVNPTTGASAAIAGGGFPNVKLPNIDGILLEAGRLWAVQNFSNQITELRLSPDLSSATVERVITNGPDGADGAFHVPTTVARFGDVLATVNAHFDSGFPPPPQPFEVVIVER